MAEQKKLTTEEILALARKKGAGEAAPSAESPSAQGGAPASPASKSTADILAAARSQGSAGADPASGGAPKSTAEILAAARAQGGGVVKPAAPKSTADILAAARAQKVPAPGGVPASSSAPGEPARPAAAVAERPPLREMVAAVKSVQEGRPPVALPSRPTAPRLPKREPPVTRRSFFGALASVTVTPFALAWAAMGAIGTLWLLATARFMMPNMVLELPSRFKIGPASDYPPGTVSEKYKASRGIWVVNTDQYDGRQSIYALLSICTHLGCTPNWLESEQKFKCPCHGSGFYITGINFEGPAPRPLERVGIRVAEDGMLEVDKSLKFQEELGQWADSKSYVEIA